MFGRKKSEEKAGGRREREAHDFVVSVQTDKGCVREINEDSGRFVRPDDEAQFKSKGALLVVADGMGGHSAGEVASGLAVQIIPELYYGSKAEGPRALKEAVEEANRRINEEAARDESKHGMGTTCTALVLQDGQAFAAHVGDSRLYMVREGRAYQLTEDHSAVMEMVKLGLITKEEARHHEDKNVILRALGTSPEVEVSTLEPFTVRAGDRYLLCSDGLYDLVTDEEIERELSTQDDIESAGRRLITLAKERGGHDNITIGIIAVAPTGASGKSGGPDEPGQSAKSEEVDIRATREWRAEG